MGVVSFGDVTPSPDLHRLTTVWGGCIPLPGYVRLSPRERRAFTDGLPASFMRACYKIRQYTAKCIREGVFHLSFVDLVFYPHVCSFSALAVRWRASAALSFWAVRRRSPACHNYYRFVFRLAGYSGARPRRHRLQAYRARRAVAAAGAGVRKLPVFPGCQNRRQPFRKLRRCVSFHAVRLWAACPAVFFCCRRSLMQPWRRITGDCCRRHQKRKVYLAPSSRGRCGHAPPAGVRGGNLQEDEGDLNPWCCPLGALPRYYYTTLQSVIVY